MTYEEFKMVKSIDIHVATQYDEKLLKEQIYSALARFAEDNSSELLKRLDWYNINCDHKEASFSQTAA